MRAAIKTDLNKLNQADQLCAATLLSSIPILQRGLRLVDLAADSNHAPYAKMIVRRRKKSPSDWPQMKKPRPNKIGTGHFFT
jgi:hypothetical protein